MRDLPLGSSKQQQQSTTAMDNDILVQKITDEAKQPEQVIVTTTTNKDQCSTSPLSADQTNKSKYINGDACGGVTPDISDDQILAATAVTLLANGLVNNDDSSIIANNKPCESSKLNNTKEYGKFRILKNYAINNEDEQNHQDGTSCPLNTTVNGTGTEIVPDLNGHDVALEEIISEVNNIPCNGDKNKKSETTDKKSTKHRAGKSNNKSKNSKKIQKTSKDDQDTTTELPQPQSPPLTRRSTRLRNKKQDNGKESGPSSPAQSSQPSQSSTTAATADADPDSNTKSKDSSDKKDSNSDSATVTSKENHKKSGKEKKNKTKHKTKRNNKEHKHGKKSGSKKLSGKRSSGKETITGKRSTKDKSHHHHHHHHRQKENPSKNEFTQPGDGGSAIQVNGGTDKSENQNAQQQPEKVKSRWRRNSELENNTTTTSPGKATTTESSGTVLQDRTNQEPVNVSDEPMPSFQSIEENIFRFERKKCKSKKETKKMVCDCILTREERARGLMGCGEDCLNRMLMIECGSRCPLGEHCSNKRFQLKQNAKVEPFKTAKKGWGLRALEPLPDNTFIMEYVGEVIDPFEFHDRVEKYSRQKIEHYYFMALRSDEIIDATTKGNITRFINHSCEPNAITQKWTVNGELRIGFFTIKPISPGEEITFDYQFQRYGKKAQVCYCETESCRGFIGSSEGGANILTDGSKIPKSRPKKKDRKDGEELPDDEEEEDEEDDEDDGEDEFLKDVALEEEIDNLARRGGLRNRQQILEVSRLLLRAEEMHLRMKLIDILMTTNELAYLRLFLDYHGLQIIWSWMVGAEDIELKARLLELLEVLPIPNKTMLIDSKVYRVVERWAAKDSPESQQYLSNINNNKANSPVEVKEESQEEPEAKSSQDQQAPLSMTLKEESEVTTKPGTETATSITVSMTPEKKTDLSKLSAKVIIKSKNKQAATSSTNNNSGQQQPANGTTGPKDRSNVTVGFLAQKLLTHWKDLKEVFRIPRLERQKRHDDEAEADRRAQEHEERRAKGLPIIHEKRLIDDRDYTIGGILGNKRRCLKSLTAGSDRELFKRVPLPSSSSTNNVNNFGINNENFTTHNSPKMSKEEHRRLFEYNVAQSDYTEALKKYQQQLEEYRKQFCMVAWQQNAAATLVPYAGKNGTEAILPGITNSIVPSMMIKSFGVGVGVETTGIETSVTSFVEDVTEPNLVRMEDLIPPYKSPVVVLTGDQNESSSSSLLNDDATISALAIDNVDYDQVKYNIDDCLDSIQDKKMFHKIYPPAGIFYATEDKKETTYFVPFSEKNSHCVVVQKNQIEPLPIDFTTIKPEPNERWKASGWRRAKTKDDHYYYYNRRLQIRQWHPPTESQLRKRRRPPAVIPASTVVTVNHPTSSVTDDININNNNCDISHPSTADNSPASENGNDKKDLSELSLEELKRKNAKRTQELFRNKISQFVVKCLNPYMKSTCKKARITRNDDFKSLARKITHAIVAKEIKQCKHIEDLACTESVKFKTKDYVRRYMGKFGPVYSPGFEQPQQPPVQEPLNKAKNSPESRPPSVGQ